MASRLLLRTGEVLVVVPGCGVVVVVAGCDVVVVAVESGCDVAVGSAIVEVLGEVNYVKCISRNYFCKF